MTTSERDVPDAPTTRDIRYEKKTRFWLRCPACSRVYDIWPAEAKQMDELPENVLINQVLDCYTSHDETPDSWEEAQELGLAPSFGDDTKDGDQG